MLVTIIAFLLLMVFAYRGYSPVLMAPVVALLAVAFTDVSQVLPSFTGIYMERFGAFVTRFFPVILLGAAFGKLLETSGMVATIGGYIGRVATPSRAIIGIVLLAALLTYGGVSVFVVAFATFPFGAMLFRKLDVPKRLLPAVITLGGGSFTLGALPGTPQLTNLIPTDVLGTSEWAAPRLGLLASALLLSLGLAYLLLRASHLRRKGEGYGDDAVEEVSIGNKYEISLLAALTPLFVVFFSNLALSALFERVYGDAILLHLPGLSKSIPIPAHSAEATWSILGALILGCASICLLDKGRSLTSIGTQSKALVTTALNSTAAVASVFGCGATLVDLPGFVMIRGALSGIQDPLLNAVASTSIVSALTGSASGGVTITVDAYGPELLQSAVAAGVPAEVLHRVLSMAAAGFDNTPHNVILLFLICGVTHRAAYPDMAGLALIKGSIPFVIVAIYYMTGLV